MDSRVPELHLGQFASIVHEPLLLHPPSRGGRVALCTSEPAVGCNGRRWRQEMLDVDQLAARLAALDVREDSSYFLSQHTMGPGARGREANDVRWLNALWVDIDLVHDRYPNGYKSAWLPLGAGLSETLRAAPEVLADLVICHVIELGLPAPTLVTASGQGLHLKWLLSEPPIAGAVNVRRWEAAETQLCGRLAEHNFGAVDQPRRWPVDKAARDVSRVLRLVGTRNPRTGTVCRVLRTAQLVDFGLMAEVLDGLSRVKQRSPMQTRASVARASRTPVADLPATATPVVVGQEVRAVWARRLQFGVAILKARGGAPEGQRNNLFWPLATAAAWCSRNAGDLHARLARLHEDLFAGGTEPWAAEEAQAAASSVVARFGRGELYMMPTRTYRALLGVTGREWMRHWRLLAAPRTCDVGAMCLAPLPAGVPYEEHVARVRARQSMAARYATATRQERRGIDASARAAARNQAFAWFAQGETPARIACELGVPRRTVRGWVNQFVGQQAWLAVLAAEAAAERERDRLKEEAERARSDTLWQWLQSMGSARRGDS